MPKDYNPKHLDASPGESPIYAGTGYLALLVRQMDRISEASRESLRYGGDTLLGWLNELKVFHDLIGIEMDLSRSEKEVDFYRYVTENGIIIKIKEMIKEKDKYAIWFAEIESLVEKNQLITENDVSRLLKYNNDKRIKMELSDCQRALYRDGNRKHTIMPKGKESMKELAKESWIDRAPTKDFD